MSDVQFRRVNRTPSTFYIPGKTPGQPHKESVFRYCYNITKKAGKQANQFGDVRTFLLTFLKKFDYFLYQADKKINYYEPKFYETNPYNPFKLEAEFKVNVVEDGNFDEMKKMLKEEHGVKTDDIIALNLSLVSRSTIDRGTSVKYYTGGSSPKAPF